MKEFLSVENLYKSFGPKEVLRNINLNFEEKKITVVIGKSGTGKSVLIKNIIGILNPDSGDIRYRGKSMIGATSKELMEFRRHFGFLFQESALFDSMTVEENIAFPIIHVQKIRDRKFINKKVAEKLDWVGMQGIQKSYPAELSGGMKKRVALARALTMDPEVLLFDEPTTGLDPILSESVDSLIYKVNKELGLTCIVISHDIPATFRIADKIAFLHEAEIHFFGTPSEAVKDTDPTLKKFISNSFTSVESIGEEE
ncbi:ABC transporter ATP-binding protein [Spirochaeta cellobiosiphila]|uniref:ABC transporter ATP-binding protein n=1 Tax=Spirochaeta cellobiosiphila TaxID=504483 RepID=UPI000427ADD6|nr:ATP-binding cassette domain-containing protein [Spirochaeta cellobiosiphila]